jgi:hypothetical protein
MDRKDTGLRAIWIKSPHSIIRPVSMDQGGMGRKMKGIRTVTKTA